jgi:signal transduction histidine kinase
MNRLRMALSSTAVRLSLLFLLLFFAASIGLVLYVTSLSAQIIETQAKTAIEQQLDGLQSAYEQAGIPGLIRFVDREARQPGAHLYLIADRSGRILSGNVSEIEPGILDRSGWVAEPFWYGRFGSGVSENYRAIAQVLKLPNGLTLLVGRDLSEPDRFRDVVKRALTLALGFMTLGALLIWLLVGRRALKRIDGVSSESRRIIGGDLSRRLPVGRSGDEFDRLASSLNGLLDRIETLDSGVRDVSNNVAHDLKTPLTRLLARTENALNTAKNPKDLKAALQSNMQETEGLIRTFNAILTISKLEAGAVLDNCLRLPVRPILVDVVELMEPTAEATGVKLELVEGSEITLSVNRELIAQAVLNLIENALRHAGEGNQSIFVELKSDPQDGVAISVSDNGIGIDPEFLEAATERFVRLDVSRTSTGTGLGLSLVKAIAEAHGGKFELSDNRPGLKATIVLPNIDAG